MAEPSTHINYSFDDVQRYLQGKMSAAEMHAIEKAALQDPFLADAIDGYREADAGTARQHLNEIHAALFAEKKENKVITFNRRTRWLNIAALVMVLAGIGVVAAYFLRPSPKQQPQIAKVQQEAAKNRSLQDSASALANSSALMKKEDSALLIAQNKTTKKTQSSIPKRKDAEEIIVAENKAAKQEEPAIFKADDTNKYTADVAIAAAPTPPVEERQMMARSFAVADTPAQLQGRVSGVSVLPFTFSGKVVDERNQPLPFVSIGAVDRKFHVVTDTNGYFTLQIPDTLLHVTAITAGYETQNIALKQGANNVIVLKEAHSGLDEVAVTTVMAKKKSRSDSAMPVGGWYNFNRYIISKLDEDSSFENNMLANDLVELEFLIDKSGNPYNIKVIKPLDDKRNSKAIEILKNGPKWTTTSGKKKAKAVINF